MTIQGKVIVMGDDVDTDQILPGYAMAEPESELGRYAMAGAPAYDFANRVADHPIIVGGRNFGCGSSREQAPRALKQAGVKLVVAAGFARIFRRNCINIGLPVFVADLTEKAKDGQMITVNLETGEVVLDNEQLAFQPVSETVRSTLACGGLIPRVQAELGIKP